MKITIDIDDDDMASLFEALGMLHPDNPAHRGLAILLGRLAVARLQPPPTIDSEREKRSLDPLPTYAESRVAGVVDMGGAAREGRPVTQAELTAFQELAAEKAERDAFVGVPHHVTPEEAIDRALGPLLSPEPEGIEGYPIPSTTPTYPGVRPELDKLHKQLADGEFELVWCMYKRSGRVPILEIITDDESVCCGVDVRYRYRGADGEYRWRTVSQRNGRHYEIVLLALRAANQRMTQDHVPEPKRDSDD